MKDNVLLDSDILLDFFLKREPFLDHASKILNLCAIKAVNGFVTGLIIANTYYLLRKHFQHKDILADFKILFTFLDVLIIDKSVIISSIDSDFLDFEDALQNFSAENNSLIKTIVTRNIKDYKKSKLSVLTPEMFLKTR
ncbi:type II toxin-antitoxin system VapC family toxin [Pedobacter suwonensis]|uniref:type II toxin-antitoxin system VapC family toxin n=1 Tax=Pedobacter suwonensis TaxID=332999 RepID=UPI0025EE3F55|nr:PIN domain-containing protein [uncultured Pedobacter sp.]